VGDTPPQAVLVQVVVRLQHCNYPLVNDPWEKPCCSTVATSTRRSETKRSLSHIVRCDPHPPVNRRHRPPLEPTGIALWIGSGQRCEFPILSGESRYFSGDDAVRFLCTTWCALWTRNGYAGTNSTVTGMPLSIALPDKGSNSWSSVRMFEFTPAFSDATAICVPGTP
jgi:hypothetical protein